MTTISQRNTGSEWDKRARYIEQSTSALQRYVAMGDEMARSTKMKEYTPQQAQEADVSLYSRLLSDEQKTGPGKMPERSTSAAHTSETTGWGKRHLAISGVSHQPYVQTAHHSNAIGPGGSGFQSDGFGSTHSTTQNTSSEFTFSTNQNTVSGSGESGDPSSTPLKQIPMSNPSGPPGDPRDKAGMSSDPFPGFKTGLEGSDPAMFADLSPIELKKSKRKGKGIPKDKLNL